MERRKCCRWIYPRNIAAGKNLIPSLPDRRFLLARAGDSLSTSQDLSSTYQVIARKWRPQTFDDVVGQDHVVRTLRNAIARNRIAHAYLFVGPRGTGKTSTARIFAKALNCTDGPKADFRADDPACLSIAEGSHLDVIEIDGASNNGVEQVRDLREAAKFSPATSKFKIYIIDEVHMLTRAAEAALLKTLEEPPAQVVFVLATSCEHMTGWSIMWTAHDFTKES